MIYSIDGKEELVWAIRKLKDQELDGVSNEGDERVINHRSELFNSDENLIGTFVPDEILNNINDPDLRTYNACILIGSIKGFTELANFYDEHGKSISNLSHILNNYVGSILQEIIAHEGDIMHISENEFMAMWKCPRKSSMRDFVHNALDSAIIIQRYYGTHEVDMDGVLHLNIGISAGPVTFSIIGTYLSSKYILAGETVGEASEEAHRGQTNDIYISEAAWYHVNSTEYLSEMIGQSIKVLGIGPNWRHRRGERFLKVEKETPEVGSTSSLRTATSRVNVDYENFMRPCIAKANVCADKLKKFINRPVLEAIERNEPKEYLNEMRHIVIVFLSVWPKIKKDKAVINMANHAYKIIFSDIDKYRGDIYSVSYYDKDVVFKMAFGLRGFATYLECQNALQFSTKCFDALDRLHSVGSVSVALMTGRANCAMIGHTLRKAYLPIGPTVNRTIVLLAEFPDRIICSRQTFLHSKMDPQHFMFQEFCILKGTKTNIPIYEYKNTKDLEFAVITSVKVYPTLGREEETKQYTDMLRKFLFFYDQDNLTTQFEKLIVIHSSSRSGKTRLLDEFLFLTDRSIPVNRISLTSNYLNTQYETIRSIFGSFFDINPNKSSVMKARLTHVLEKFENPDLFCIFNIVFGVDFPSSERLEAFSDQERQMTLVSLFKYLCFACFTSPNIIAIDNAHYMDDLSWELLLILLSSESVFVIMTVTKYDKMSMPVKEILHSKYTTVIQLPPINPIYHAGIACQMLKCYALPSNLEKFIQKNSRGNPGWIEGLVVCLRQERKIMLKRMKPYHIFNMDLVLPPMYMMHRLNNKKLEEWKHVMEEKPLQEHTESKFDNWNIYIESCRDAIVDIKTREVEYKQYVESDMIPVCVLDARFNLSEIDLPLVDEMTTMQICDSLTVFEQQVLKYASSLGDIFPRNLLEYLLSNTQREIAIAIQHMFEESIFCCARGDFSQGGNYLLLRDNNFDPAKDDSIKCYCLGLYIEEPCYDLPKYASCGFLRFRSPQLRINAYYLMTSEQNVQVHKKAAKYIEYETRQCLACGGRYINAVDEDQGLIDIERQSKFKARLLKFEEIYSESTVTEENIQTDSGWVSSLMTPRMTLKGDKRMTIDKISFGSGSVSVESKTRSIRTLHNMKLGMINPRTLYKLQERASLIKTYSGVDMSRCECHLIVSAMHQQLVKHFRGSGQWQRMMESIISYAETNISAKNVSAASNAITTGLNFMKENSSWLDISEWKIPVVEAKLYTLQGITMFKENQLKESCSVFLLAITKFGFEFPVTKCGSALKLWKKRLRQKLGLYMFPDSFKDKNLDFDSALTLDNMSQCLTYICNIYMIEENWRLAELAGVWSLTLSMEAQVNLTTICNAFTNMLCIAKIKNNRLLQKVLEVHALRFCHKKRISTDIDELKSIINLYQTIAFTRISRGEVDKGLHLNYIFVKLAISINYKDAIWRMMRSLLYVLLQKLYLTETASLLYEFEFHCTDTEDAKATLAYYTYGLVLHIETGYCVTPINLIEMYHHSEVLNISKSECMGSKGIFLVYLWLWYLRNCHFESAEMLQQVIDQVIQNKTGLGFIQLYMACYLIEGSLLKLVYAINRRNINKIIYLNKLCKNLLNRLRVSIKRGKEDIIKARSYCLEAYYEMIHNNIEKTKRLLKKSKKCAQQCQSALEMSYVEHAEESWFMDLPKQAMELWKTHCKSYNLLDIRELHSTQMKVVRFRLPLPDYFLY